MHLTCYRLSPHPPELVPARSDRAWMDEMEGRFPYRCTPLTMANSTGWELLCPTAMRASWNGGPGLGDMVIEQEDKSSTIPNFAHSHFGHGVLTFHPGYLFRTDPEWAIWCRGAPNFAKEGIAALDGLIETDWLPFGFSMNWRFTRPGTVRFDKGEPFCFVLPLPHLDIERIRPVFRPLSDNPELTAEYQAWSRSRQEFNKLLHQRDPATIKERWQRFYLSGKSPGGMVAPDSHRIKRKMLAPGADADIKPPAALESVTAKSLAPRPLQAKPGQALAQAEPARTKPSGLKLLDRPALSDQTSQNIVWIASYPKSGNTWVRAFIHNLLNELAGVKEAHDINRLNEHTIWEFAAKPFERVLGKSLAAADQGEIAAARPEVQRQLAGGGTDPVLVKTHLCVGNEHQHPTINLDATLAAIYIVRNPLDVAISYAHHSGTRIDSMIATMATRGLKTPDTPQAAYEILGSWSENIASWLGLTDRPIHVVRYEDLLANPIRLFGTLARFLGLAPSEQQLKAAIAKSSFGELRRQESENGFKERPKTAKVFFREGRAGQWPDVLSPVQIQEITRLHAPMMQRLGYLSPDCGKPLRLKQMA